MDSSFDCSTNRPLEVQRHERINEVSPPPYEPYVDDDESSPNVNSISSDDDHSKGSEDQAYEDADAMNVQDDISSDETSDQDEEIVYESENASSLYKYPLSGIISRAQGTFIQSEQEFSELDQHIRPTNETRQLTASPTTQTSEDLIKYFEGNLLSLNEAIVMSSLYSFGPKDDVADSKAPLLANSFNVVGDYMPAEADFIDAISNFGELILDQLLSSPFSNDELVIEQFRKVLGLQQGDALSHADPLTSIKHKNIAAMVHVTLVSLIDKAIMIAVKADEQLTSSLDSTCETSYFLNPVILQYLYHQERKLWDLPQSKHFIKPWIMPLPKRHPETALATVQEPSSFRQQRQAPHNAIESKERPRKINSEVSKSVKYPQDHPHQSPSSTSAPSRYDLRSHDSPANYMGVRVILDDYSEILGDSYKRSRRSSTGTRDLERPSLKLGRLNGHSSPTVDSHVRKPSSDKSLQRGKRLRDTDDSASEVGSRDVISTTYDKERDALGSMEVKRRSKGKRQHSSKLKSSSTTGMVGPMTPPASSPSKTSPLARLRSESVVSLKENIVSTVAENNLAFLRSQYSTNLDALNASFVSLQSSNSFLVSQNRQYSQQLSTCETQLAQEREAFEVAILQYKTLAANLDVSLKAQRESLVEWNHRLIENFGAKLEELELRIEGYQQEVEQAELSESILKRELSLNADERQSLLTKIEELEADFKTQQNEFYLKVEQAMTEITIKYQEEQKRQSKEMMNICRDAIGKILI